LILCLKGYPIKQPTGDLPPKADQKLAAIERLSEAFGPVLPSKGKRLKKAVKNYRGSSAEDYSSFN